jgi:hypothetical protein
LDKPTDITSRGAKGSYAGKSAFQNYGTKAMIIQVPSAFGLAATSPTIPLL